MCATDPVWRQLDPVLWELTHYPCVILQTVSREKLQRVLAEPAFRKRTNKAAFVSARRVALMSSMGLFAPIEEVDMKSAPGPVRASRTDRRSDRSRP